MSRGGLGLQKCHASRIVRIALYSNGTGSQKESLESGAYLDQKKARISKEGIESNSFFLSLSTSKLHSSFVQLWQKTDIQNVCVSLIKMRVCMG